MASLPEAPQHALGADMEVCCRGKWRHCVVVERRGGAGVATVEYYVHFPHWDRRMDTWVTHGELRPSRTNGPAKGSGGSSASAPPAGKPAATTRHAAAAAAVVEFVEEEHGENDGMARRDTIYISLPYISSLEH